MTPLIKANYSALILLMGLFLCRCAEPEIIAEYTLNWKKCANGIVQLRNDSTYLKSGDHVNETGTWDFKSVKDSIICLKREETITMTTNVPQCYFIENNILFPIECIEIEVDFEWILGKNGPRWTLSSAIDSEELNSISDNATQIISSIDSSEWRYAYKGENGNFHLTLVGHYFLEDQPGVSAGGADYNAKAFLALEKKRKKGLLNEIESNRRRSVILEQTLKKSANTLQINHYF